MRVSVLMVDGPGRYRQVALDHLPDSTATTILHALKNDKIDAEGVEERHLFHNCTALDANITLAANGVIDGDILVAVKVWDVLAHDGMSPDPSIGVRPFGPAVMNDELNFAVRNALEALQAGYTPHIAEDGAGGTYFLPRIPPDPIEGHDERSGAVQVQYVACFKPRDEELGAPANPRGRTGTGIMGVPLAEREGFRVGDAAYREVAAYYLDQAWGGTAGVPPTMLVEAWHPAFCNVRHAGQHHMRGVPWSSSETTPIPKLGSLQCFVSGADPICERGSNTFTDYDIQKIALFDLRVMNSDRNDENVLFRTIALPAADVDLCDVALAWRECNLDPTLDWIRIKVGEESSALTQKSVQQLDEMPEKGKSNVSLVNRRRPVYSTVPIDHGLILPEHVSLYKGDWVWASWSQAKKQLHPKLRACLAAWDVESDIRLLKAVLGSALRPACYTTLRISHTVLKACLLDGGLSLAETCAVIGRAEMDRPSKLERMITAAQGAASAAIEPVPSRYIGPLVGGAVPTESRAKMSIGNGLRPSLLPPSLSHLRSSTATGSLESLIAPPPMAAASLGGVHEASFTLRPAMEVQSFPIIHPGPTTHSPAFGISTPDATSGSVNFQLPVDKERGPFLSGNALFLPFVFSNGNSADELGSSMGAVLPSIPESSPNGSACTRDSQLAPASVVDQFGPLALPETPMYPEASPEASLQSNVCGDFDAAPFGSLAALQAARAGSAVPGRQRARTRVAHGPAVLSALGVQPGSLLQDPTRDMQVFVAVSTSMDPALTGVRARRGTPGGVALTGSITPSQVQHGSDNCEGREKSASLFDVFDIGPVELTMAVGVAVFARSTGTIVSASVVATGKGVGFASLAEIAHAARCAIAAAMAVHTAAVDASSVTDGPDSVSDPDAFGKQLIRLGNATVSRFAPVMHSIAGDVGPDASHRTGRNEELDSRSRTASVTLPVVSALESRREASDGTGTPPASPYPGRQLGISISLAPSRQASGLSVPGTEAWNVPIAIRSPYLSRARSQPGSYLPGSFNSGVDGTPAVNNAAAVVEAGGHAWTSRSRTSTLDLDSTTCPRRGFGPGHSDQVHVRRALLNRQASLRRVASSLGTADELSLPPGGSPSSLKTPPASPVTAFASFHPALPFPVETNAIELLPLDVVVAVAGPVDLRDVFESATLSGWRNGSTDPTVFSGDAHVANRGAGQASGHARNSSSGSTESTASMPGIMSSHAEALAAHVGANSAVRDLGIRAGALALRAAKMVCGTMPEPAALPSFNVFANQAISVLRRESNTEDLSPLGALAHVQSNGSFFGDWPGSRDSTPVARLNVACSGDVTDPAEHLDEVEDEDFGSVAEDRASGVTSDGLEDDEEVFENYGDGLALSALSIGLPIARSDDSLGGPRQAVPVSVPHLAPSVDPTTELEDVPSLFVLRASLRTIMRAADAQRGLPCCQFERAEVAASALRSLRRGKLASSRPQAMSQAGRPAPGLVALPASAPFVVPHSTPPLPGLKRVGALPAVEAPQQVAVAVSTNSQIAAQGQGLGPGSLRRHHSVRVIGAKFASAHGTGRHMASRSVLPLGYRVSSIPGLGALKDQYAGDVHPVQRWPDELHGSGDHTGPQVTSIDRAARTAAIRAQRQRYENMLLGTLETWIRSYVDTQHKKHRGEVVDKG